MVAVLQRAPPAQQLPIYTNQTDATSKRTVSTAVGVAENDGFASSVERLNRLKRLCGSNVL